MAFTSEELRKQIGAEILKIRKNMHLNLREMAELINETPPHDLRVSLYTLHKYETAVISIPAVKLEKIRSLAS